MLVIGRLLLPPVSLLAQVPQPTEGGGGLISASSEFQVLCLCQTYSFKPQCLSWGGFNEDLHEYLARFLRHGEFSQFQGLITRRQACVGGLGLLFCAFPATMAC